MKYVVTYIEYGDSVDGRARALGLYDLKEDAERAIEDDMATYAETLDDPFIDDWAVWSCEKEAWENGCAWNITELI